MTARRSATDRHRDLRERKRAAGLQRRTVWLDAESLTYLDTIKARLKLTQDHAIAHALLCGMADASKPDWRS